MAINLYAAANRNRGIALTDFITAFDATVTDSADAANTDTVAELAEVMKATIQAGTVTNVEYNTTTQTVTVTYAGGTTATIDLSGLASTGTPTLTDGSVHLNHLEDAIKQKLITGVGLNGTTLEVQRESGANLTVDLASIGSATVITQFPTGIFWLKGQNERYPRDYPFADNRANSRKRMTYGSDTPDEDFGNFHSTVGNIWVPVSEIPTARDPAQADAARQYYKLPSGRYDIEVIGKIRARNLIANLYLAVEKVTSGSDDELIVLSIPYAEATLESDVYGTAFAPIELHDWVSDGTAVLSNVFHDGANSGINNTADDMGGYMRIKKVG